MNSSKPKVLMIIVVALIIINVATISFVWFGRPPRGQRPDGQQPAQFLIERVGFSKEQADAYFQLIKIHRGQNHVLNDSIRFFKRQTFSYLTSNDSVSAKRSAIRVGTIQQKIELNTFDHFAKVRALCTPDQVAKFDATIDEVLRMMAPPGPPGPPEHQ